MAGSSLQSAPVRATRFTVHVPLHYRRVGEEQWHEGVAENISQSGVFFRGDRSLSEEEVVEINFALRTPIGPEPRQACTGIVVRTDRSRVSGGQPAFGTRFLD